MDFDLREIVSHFRIYGHFVKAVQFGNGHINDTFQVTFDQGGTWVRYIVQRVNTRVFRNPKALMQNYQRVTRHLGAKIDQERITNPATRRRSIELVEAVDGRPFWCDSQDNFFRCYVFVEHARSYDILETPEQAYQAAAAFGGFQADLSDLSGRLNETIPNFHNTPSRLVELQVAAWEDRMGRLKSVSWEYDFILERSEECERLLALQREGLLVERVTHNDTKLNNVLIDDLTGMGCCVIDLDTVMPGLPHYDFGDMVRTGTSPVAEDETDLSRVVMRFPMFEALLRGYLAGAGDFLSVEEKSWLPFSGKLITLEIGIRFLTDYLDGDVYFKIHRPDHNLDRCRTQLKLVASIEEQFDAMRQLTEELL